MSVSAVVALASRLIGIDTVGRNESAALDVLEPLLEGAGLAVTRQEWAPGRANLVATWAGGGGFVLSGHVDTCPSAPSRGATGRSPRRSTATGSSAAGRAT